MPLNLNRATADHMKLIMQMSPAVVKQVHNTTFRRLLQVRQVLARGCSGLTSGNHGVSRLSELNVTSSRCDGSLRAGWDSNADSATTGSSSSKPSEMVVDCSRCSSRLEEREQIALGNF